MDSQSHMLVFGGFLIPLGSLADSFGRRRIMILGLVILALVSLSTLLVAEVWQLIVIRAITGIAAAMTAPGSMALAYPPIRQ